MTVSTAYMGLSSWAALNDPYSHDQLAANWIAIDAHDHVLGKGKQIPTGGIQDGAITTAKLADNSVTSIKIVDGTIDLADLSAALLMKLSPIGEVRSWWRPTISDAVPTGWVVPHGQTLTSGQHSFAGGGSIVLPNLINKYLLGASASDVSGAPAPGVGPTNPPAIGATGGGNTLDLRHTHVVPHDHSGATGGTAPTANANTNFGTSTSSPGTDSQGSHDHRFWTGGGWSGMKQRGVGIRVNEAQSFVWYQTAYVPILNSGADPWNPSVPDANVIMETTGGHSHNVNAHSHTVPGHTHPVSSHTHTISNDSPATGNPSPDFSAVDGRPAFVGLLPIMKVQHS